MILAHMAGNALLLCRFRYGATVVIQSNEWGCLRFARAHLGGRRFGGPHLLCRHRFERGDRFPRAKSLTKLKDAVRAATKRTSGSSLKMIIVRLNPRLRGWFAYFKHSHRYTFDRLDGWIRMRLRSLLRNRQGKTGCGRGSDHQLWPNAFFTEYGLYSFKSTHARECQSSSR